MAEKKWEQAKEIFAQALERDEQELAAYLEQACAGDGELLEFVKNLLAADAEAGSFIEKPLLNPAAVEESRVGQFIGPYRILRVLGHGGMGAVYLAVRDDDQYKKHVAIKLIKRGMDSEDIVRRFRHERQILAGLDHPNIARLLDGGMTEDGLPYFVMEHIEGQPFDVYCDTHKLTTIERLKLFRPVCAAVQYAHRNLIVHRDLKPSNILVTGDGVPKLLDFGIAKLLNPDLSPLSVQLTQAGLKIMTPEYASPEQVRGEPITTASDVYSLGVLLYELLTGHRPYRLKSRVQKEIERVICEVEPEKPSTAVSRVEEVQEAEGTPTTQITPQAVSEKRDGKLETLRRRLQGDIDNIVLMALRKEPQRRYASVEQFSEDIRRHLEREPVVARKDTAWYLSTKFIARHRVGFAATVLVALSLIGGIAGTAWQANVANNERDKARLEAQKSEQVTAFLVNLFKVSNPSAARGDTITAREILDRGAQRIERELNNQPINQTKMMDVIGEIYHNLGHYDKANSLFDGALQIRRQNFGEEHLDVATSLNNLGIVLYAKGQYAVSDSFMKEALAIRRKLLGNAHPDFARNLLNLANVYQVRGDLQRTESLIREALEIQRKNNGEKSLETAGALNNLAMLLYNKCNYAEAEPLYHEALTIQRKQLGDDHLDVAQTMNNLSALLYMKADFEAAENLYRQVLEIRRRHLGEEHPNVVMSLYNLANVLYVKGEYAAAVPLYHESLKKYRKLMGAEHPNVAMFLLGLGMAQSGVGDCAAADTTFRQALAIHQKVFGLEHPMVAQDLHSLGMLKLLEGDWKAAEPFLRQALALRQKFLGVDHHETALTMTVLAQALAQTGDYQSAKQLLSEAVAHLRKKVGNEHPYLGESLNALAEVYFADHQDAKAESLYSAALDLRRKALALGHLDLSSSALGLGKVLIREGKFQAAKPHVDEGLAIRQKALPAKHWLIAEAQGVMGECLAGLRRYEEAEKLLRESYAIIKQTRGDGSNESLATRERVIALYEAWGKPEKAVEYRAMLPKGTAEKSK